MDAGRVERAVVAAVEAADLDDDRDQAAVELAVSYARAIDGEGDLPKNGGALLRVLDALLLTPKARLARKSTGPVPAPAEAPPNPLDELRERRAARSTTTG